MIIYSSISKDYSPHEAGLGVIICDLGVFRVLICSWDVFAGVITVFHRHRQKVRGHLLPAITARLTGDLCAERQAAENREEGVCVCGGGAVNV